MIVRLNMVLLSILFVAISYVTISFCLNDDKEEGTYYLVKIPAWLFKRLIEERKDKIQESGEDESELSSEESSEYSHSKSKGNQNSTTRSSNEENSVRVKGESINGEASTNKPGITNEQERGYQKNDLQEITQASSRELGRRSDKSNYDYRDKNSNDDSDLQLHSGTENKDLYFSYGHVYAPQVFEFGYRQGNKGHFTERREARKGPATRIALKWGDSKSGYGEQYWDLGQGSKQ